MSTTKKKPTGEIKSWTLEVNDGVATKSESILVFPDQKDAIEKFVMDRYIAAWRSNMRVNYIVDYYQNVENDFDYTIKTTNGSIIYVDLMEIAILKKGGYDKASPAHKVGDYVDFVVKNIMKKSDKYMSKNDIFLLMYITDDKFNLSDSILHCLAYELNVVKKHKFYCIDIIGIHHEIPDRQITIYPRPDTIPQSEYELLRENTVYNLVEFE